MKKIFTIFFVTLGVIFFFIILAVLYFFIVDPFNIKPFIFNNDQTKEIQRVQTSSSTVNVTGTNEQDSTADKNLSLSPIQEKALETIGIEPSKIPSSFTPEQLTCFEEKLGKVRVTEIKNGDAPSATEFYKAKDCI